MDSIDGDFEQVWLEQRDHLWRVAWLICGDLDVADDVLAAAGARAWRGWARRGVLRPEAYLRRAVVNEKLPRSVRLEPGTEPVPRLTAVNLDSLESVSLAVLVERLDTLSTARMAEVCAPMAVAIDCVD